MRRLAFVGTIAAMFAGCVEQGPEGPSEEDIKAAREHVLTQAPATIKYKVDADLDDKVTYLGCDVDTETVSPGKPFTLTHYWRVNKPIPDGWKLFIHLEAPDTKKNHLNADHVPVSGKYPVHVWKPGEIIRDIHRVSVPGSWSAPAVEIYVGLWKGPVRMKVTKGPHDAENRILAVKLPTEAAVAKVERKRIIAKHVKTGVLKLDGKLDEKEWKDANASEPFKRSLDGLVAEQATHVKVLWDDKYLWVAFSMDDRDVWSTLEKRDDKLWTQEAVEMFIDADGDGKNYIELQSNPRGALFDSYLPGYRQNQNDFDSGTKVAVKVDGTLDNRNDLDRGWTVEMQIPLIAARGKEKEMKNVPPKVGTEWRVNFFRLDMPAGRPQWGSAWSPPMVGDFHALDKFGTLVFGDDKGNAPGVAATPATPATPAPTQPQKAMLPTQLMHRPQSAAVRTELQKSE